MGADVYFYGYKQARKRIFKKHKLTENQFYNLPEGKQKNTIRCELEPAEDSFYFRDSYNESNLLWVLGLSWWVDVLPHVRKDGTIAISTLKKIREGIATRPIVKLPSWEDEDALIYFTEKRKDLLEKLDNAIKQKKSPVFSL